MRISRRDLFLALTAAAYAGIGLDSKKRIERALAGKDVDRPPFSAWHHFHLESEPPEVFAKATIEFHQQTGTDLVKVMSDFAYPKPVGGLDRLQVETNPFPAQIHALELIRDSIGAENYFVETIFNLVECGGKTFVAGISTRSEEQRPAEIGRHARYRYSLAD